MITSCSPSTLAGALARLAEQPNPQDWALIVEQAGADCWRCCLAICGSSALAEDALQETLLQVRDKSHLFQVKTDDPDEDARRWLKRVSTTTALQLYRSRGRAMRRDLLAGNLAATSVEIDPGAALSQSDDIEALRDALTLLNEPQRTAITLHHLHGISLAAVAIELNKPEGTIKSWVYRGLEELRTRLACRGVTVSTTSLLMLFANMHANAAAAIFPPALAAASINLFTAPVFAGANVITITTPGVLSMSIKVAITSAVIATMSTIPFIMSAEKSDNADKAPKVNDGKKEVVVEPAKPNRLSITAQKEAPVTKAPKNNGDTKNEVKEKSDKKQGADKPAEAEQAGFGFLVVEAEEIPPQNNADNPGNDNQEAFVIIAVSEDEQPPVNNAKKDNGKENGSKPVTADKKSPSGNNSKK